MSAESARRNVRILTWIGFATGVIGGLLITFPTVIGLASPWVQVALGVATLVMAFRARKIGMAEVEGEGDESQFLVDRDLCQFGVLDTVRPAPENLT